MANVFQEPVPVAAKLPSLRGGSKTSFASLVTAAARAAAAEAEAAGQRRNSKLASPTSPCDSATVISATVQQPAADTAVTAVA